MNLTDDNEQNVADEWLIERLRLHRNRLLVESDWTQLSDAPVDRQAWADYRQALRDLPATWKPAPTVNFPERPM
jgi:hypothetical protein